MKHTVLIMILAMTLAGCAGALHSVKAAFAPRPAPSNLQSLTFGGQSAASLDQTSAAQMATALATPNITRVLGAVSVALGSPSEQGFWVKSAMVTAPTNGRVELTTGQGVNVTLLPSTAGATMSLAAYRALGLALTDLPKVQILALP